MIQRRPLWMLLVAVFVATILGSYASILITQDDKQLCEAQNDSRAVLRRVLLLSQSQRNTFPAVIVYRDREENVTIRFPTRDSGTFYRDALRLAAPIRC